MGHAYSSRCSCGKCSRITNRAAREERSERSAAASRSNAPGRLAQGLVSGAIAAAGATAQPEQASDTTQTNFERWSQARASNDRTDHLNEATRDKGQATGETNSPA
jgi:hypothetical protein